jgi:DNA-binding PadR family transcriptional regulator
MFVGMYTHEKGDRGRHHRRGPWGPFPFEFMFGQRGGGGPRARRGDVRAAVLALLRERPMHGYEMIQELQTRSRGVWRPSAGSIYPTLQLLEDEGLVAAEEIEGKRRFTLTAEGIAEADRRGATRPPWEEAGEAANAPAGRLRDGVFQLGAAVMQVVQTGTEDQVARTLDILNDARRRIYTLLGEDIGADADETGEA